MKIWRRSMVKIHAQIRGSIGEYHKTEKAEEAMETGRSSSPKPRSKYKPKGIDPAYPNKNFVKASYENKGENYYEHIYSMFPMGGGEPTRKASGYGHSIGQRAGKLRLSGNPSAHRIGRRTK